ncbi:hypothetical protein INT47_007179 [Mucor saturninus]|uniref:Uncharacterized protein n=1 Tax=Mucor saturninus TaxID=64648 RepID=A0A8H7R6A6_9FUNG|nr:hypothetical protein INT47_007179 [Mucor saturninus]
MFIKSLKRFEKLVLANMNSIRPILAEKNSVLLNGIDPTIKNAELSKALKRHAIQIDQIRKSIEIGHIRHQTKKQVHTLASLDNNIPKPSHDQDDSSLKITIHKNIVSALAKLNPHPNADNYVIYRFLYQRCQGRLYHITRRNKNKVPENYKQDLMKYLNKNAQTLGIHLSNCEDNWIAEDMISVAHYHITKETSK